MKSALPKNLPTAATWRLARVCDAATTTKLIQNQKV